ncbi:MAG: esterase [Betaproteobacteria bacterium HGW-Betaproteobacteria-7]|jgi:poly(hydroxyalkanoate) depolymerase family esterase|nr:MAG: esterase [Betaproteobacteria bacterium HGW-Betaproteobacteria-7]
MNFSDALRRSFPIGSFDIASINNTIEQALSSAGLNTQTGPMKNVMETIQQSLAAAGLNQSGPAAREHGVTIDGIARKIFTPDEAPTRPAAPADQVSPGQFVSRSFTNQAGTRAYKLYVPASYAGPLGEPVPVIVMLHGCTQSPDDFAAGTRMNALAEEHGFLVVYPAQAANANGSKCWNWFRAEDQDRDRGEPSLIAGITREVVASHHVDARRVFVAGLSSGAAMAVILGETYPDIYAAVGAHSGLPYGAAHDMPSAFAAMKGGTGLPGMAKRSGSGAQHTAAGRGVPTIVFHGDRDHTVDARNGAEIVDQAVRGHSDEARLQASTRQGAAAAGRQYSHTVYADAADQPVVEQWVLHGAGHAWSGGSPNGSFTDKGGPDASAEMIRFFYSQPRAGTA